jgi:hypothetical protein
MSADGDCGRGDAMPAASLRELDHVFCFVERGAPAERARLEPGGLTPSLIPEFRHDGQGTACTGLVFEEHFLEFIYVVDEDEARANPMQLHRRAPSTGGCRFGIALRGSIDDLLEEEFFDYRRDSWPASVPSLRVHRSSVERFDLPVLFADRRRAIGARNRSRDGAALVDARRSPGIESVRIELPAADAFPRRWLPESVAVVAGPRASMRVTLKGENRVALVVNDALTIDVPRAP